MLGGLLEGLVLVFGAAMGLSFFVEAVSQFAGFKGMRLKRFVALSDEVFLLCERLAGAVEFP